MDELYREQILEHYKRPHNFGRLEEPDLEFDDSNPFCGDEQHVTIRLDEEDRVAEVAFEGQGCAISTAATSLLTDELVGKTREELLRLPKEFVLDLLGIENLGNANEVRDARPQGRQERQPRHRRRMGGRGRARQSPRGGARNGRSLAQRERVTPVAHATGSVSRSISSGSIVVRRISAPSSETRSAI